MKRVLAAVFLILLANAAAAAIHYEFQQTSHSDIDNSTELTGRAIIDGSRSRVEFLAGNAYPPGTYVLTSNGSRRMLFVDPLSKSYTEVNAGAIAGAIGSTRITVENLKHTIEKIPGSDIYAGVPTEHYRVVITYDMTVTMKAVPVRQTVRTDIDAWTTVQFGDVNENFLQTGGIRTGNADLDKVIDLETTVIKGFPLRKVVKITTSTPRQVAGSKLGFRPVRTQTRELVITSIKDAPAEPALFIVPAVYRRSDTQQLNAPQTQVQILSMEPSSR
ncbi:MAG TPA: hypothetical protein VFL80_06180 [Thermoanaerobaculia bacterium]|nr:hypothetical protein [Thermoanaerobaculia bacterium]